MSKINGYSFIKNFDHAIELLEKSQKRVTSLEEASRQQKMKIDLLNKRIENCELKAQHFDILIKATKDNKLVQASWEKFMMTLRMCGYDK